MSNSLVSKTISAAIIVFTILAVFFLGDSPVMNINSNNFDILYSSKSCTSCQKLDKFLKDNNIEIETIYIEENREIFLEKNIKSLPSLYLKDGSNINGYENISKFIKTNEIKVEKKQALGIFGVLVAALIDSFNPCAIASLIFILAYFKQNEDKKKIITSGILFGLTIFVVYFLIGLLILIFQKTFISYPLFPKILGIIVILICSYGIFETVENIVKEEMRCKGGICRIDDLPDEEAAIRKSKLLNNKSIILTGIIVAFSEFACTGQVYIPTLSLAGTSAKVLSYLFIYNLIFICPIIIITLAYNYLQNDKFQSKIDKNKKLIMYLNLSLFIFLFGFSFSYYFL